MKSVSSIEATAQMRARAAEYEALLVQQAEARRAGVLTQVKIEEAAAAIETANAKLKIAIAAAGTLQQADKALAAACTRAGDRAKATALVEYFLDLLAGAKAENEFVHVGDIFSIRGANCPFDQVYQLVELDGSFCLASYNKVTVNIARFEDEDWSRLTVIFMGNPLEELPEQPIAPVAPDVDLMATLVAQHNPVLNEFLTVSAVADPASNRAMGLRQKVAHFYNSMQLLLALGKLVPSGKVNLGDYFEVSNHYAETSQHAINGIRHPRGCYVLSPTEDGFLCWKRLRALKISIDRAS